MFTLARTLRRTVVARDLAVHQRDTARAEAHAIALAERLDELTAANQSYDKAVGA